MFAYFGYFELNTCIIFENLSEANENLLQTKRNLSIIKKEICKNKKDKKKLLEKYNDTKAAYENLLAVKEIIESRLAEGINEEK